MSETLKDGVVSDAPKRGYASETAADRDMRRATWLARVLDDYYIDPIIGFVLPGLGDFIGSMLGFYIVLVAVRRDLPRVVIARMLFNLAQEAVVGAIPLVGDVYDAVYKANRRNLALLQSRAPQGPPKLADYAVIAAASLAFSLALLIPIATFFWLITAIAHNLG